MRMETVRFRPLEMLLSQIIVYSVLWLTHEYLASMLSLTFGAIALLILLISLVVEWLEPSRVPATYWRFMLATVLAPIAAAAIHYLVTGSIDWLQQ